jgi:hypothetical protein
LRGRFHECEILDLLWEAVREGESGALVVRGEPGVGKSALLEYVAGKASGCRVARAAGVQSEMELAFSGLDQLCAPMLDRVDRLPEPQRDALRTAFGLAGGAAPDRFLVGLAVLGLLSDAADEEPLVCVVDDAQWLDRASAQALAFVARRLVAESVALVFAVREPGDEQNFARTTVCPASPRCPAASRKASLGGSCRCPRPPAGCCCWRPPNRSATRLCCCGRLTGSESRPRPPMPPSPRDWWNSVSR